MTTTNPTITVNMASSYEFSGTHFISSYTGCKAGTLGNIDALRKAMTEAVAQSGATILKMIDHPFESMDPNGEQGYTSIYLLSESHASIHTYPEVGSCFVDMFTCGTRCSYEKFDSYLRDYLQPSDYNVQVIRRDTGLETLRRYSRNECYS